MMLAVSVKRQHAPPSRPEIRNHKCGHERVGARTSLLGRGHAAAAGERYPATGGFMRLPESQQTRSPLTTRDVPPQPALTDPKC